MPQSPSSRTNTKIKVLLIDDEVKLLEALAKYLESRGVSVLTAKSTHEAFNILMNNTPDLLIVDIMMPSQTGYDFVSEMRLNKRFALIPFIFLTAKGMTKDRIQGYRLGCRAYITKPFDPEELITVINNIIIEKKDTNNIKKISSEIKRIRFLLENKNHNYILFTPREKRILLEITEGNSNKIIGKKMKIGIRNVEKYVTRLLSKTKSRNRTDLVKFAYKFYNSIRANDENRTRE